ncbi:MAG: Asp-tRNA(Asn)/Glu-tRNA(Gln) amidotransferase subunit GatA [Spirochaetaceae bacterium]|nr:Asp-tRNA(Asn)/Glu-tRNA(Gln) amidotransferase subunit GatA [Spirochaetaceae bacterium]
MQTIEGVRSALAAGATTSEKLVEETASIFQADAQSELPLNAFLEIYDDAILCAKEADELRAKASAEGEAALKKLLEEKPLLGVPFAVKDNISVKGHKLTCASKILEGYVAPYNATVIQRLLDAGAIPVGRCNMDEFAMGSSTEYSAYGATRNPINRQYVSGGSSGGSTAAVAANQALFGLGTETGGSVRLPASYCGVYGLKPTYGVLSRWGVVAYGSSLDQVGLLGHTPADIALPLSVMSGQDMYDDTSADLPEADSLKNLCAMDASQLAALKIAVPRQFLEAKGMDEDVAATFEATRNWFQEKGASITVVDLPILDAAIASYYVIALSEAASNLSRFDGIRYGRRRDPGQGFDELYVQTRSEGFGPEVRRRIVIGNYVLSEQFSGDCYKKGMTVRARIQREMAELFKEYDLILCPTCPTAAFKLGQKVDDPLEMYLSDLFTTFVNLARIPSLSVPAGATKDGMPIGIQFAGAMFSEAKILQIAQVWENDHPGCGIPVKADCGGGK